MGTGTIGEKQTLATRLSDKLLKLGYVTERLAFIRRLTKAKPRKYRGMFEVHSPEI